MSAPGQGSFVPKRIEITQVHGSLSQEVVQITVDRLSLILHKHADAIARRRGWIAPGGIFLTLLITLETATFKEWLLPTNVWSALFLVLAIASGAWLIIALIRAMRAPSIEDLVQKIKSG